MGVEGLKSLNWKEFGKAWISGCGEWGGQGRPPVQVSLLLRMAIETRDACSLVGPALHGLSLPGPPA
jgi:hypothetical protein